MLAKGFGVNGSEAELALEALGDRLEGFGESFALLYSFGKDIGEGNASLLIYC